jgi:glutaredoxin
MTPTIVLYGKAGCHLCDEAKETLTEVRKTRPFELTEVDVSLDPVLHARYGERIPVVNVDGLDAFELHVSAPELERLLDTVSP